MTTAKDYLRELPEIVVSPQSAPVISDIQNVVVALHQLSERLPEAIRVTTPGTKGLVSGGDSWCVLDMTEVESRQKLFKPHTGVNLVAVTLSVISDTGVQMGMFMPCWSPSPKVEKRVGAFVFFNSYGGLRTCNVYSHRFTEAAAEVREEVWHSLVREILGLPLPEVWHSQPDWKLRLSERDIIALGFPAAQATVQEALTLLPKYIEEYH